MATAYTELIKNFQKVRDYMRDFYVYGFKSRQDFAKAPKAVMHSGVPFKPTVLRKSLRSYDNERRRIESYLGKYMTFNRTASGKKLFISIDTRNITKNPLYDALKSKSFTDGDITLHFIIFDILYNSEVCYTLKEITEKLDNEYLCFSDIPTTYDESGIRKKLKEYNQLGLIDIIKNGRSVLYRRSMDINISDAENAVHFFSESEPLGIIGNYIADKGFYKNNIFTFKHHYINSVLDSEILYTLFCAISDKSSVIISKTGRNSKELSTNISIVPLKIYISTQSGRQHLIAYNIKTKKFMSYRIDYILAAKINCVYTDFDMLCQTFQQKYMPKQWGVYCGNNKKSEHIQFDIYIDSDEEHIINRLKREKRCGKIEKINENTYRFIADVYDSGELKPWIRTFICRIENFNFSNRTVENELKQEFEQMYEMYCTED